jgi:hypothetical protein
MATSKKRSMVTSKVTEVVEFSPKEIEALVIAEAQRITGRKTKPTDVAEDAGCCALYSMTVSWTDENVEHGDVK